MSDKKPVHWADQTALRVIAEKGDKNAYVCAAGITPSGTIHVGNFREIITVELVVRALRSLGKKVRFIYSWDDYDVFRRVPANMPQQEMLKKHLRKAIVDIPDPFGTEESYARHHEVEIENAVSRVGIHPEFLYQAKKYRAGEYIEETKIALQKTKEIKNILDQYRKEPLADDWLPILGYCPECGKDEVTFSDYDGQYGIKMSCTNCQKNIDVNLKEAPFISLRWRIDWPMRWHYEKVDMEPAGKDHFVAGGSRTTGELIVKEVYGSEAPVGFMYEWIDIKGGLQFASSKGIIITLGEVLEIYEPEIVRWLFAGSRPKSVFSITFDVDVIKIYEDFDKCERIYFGAEEVGEKKAAQQKRIYELSCVDKIPENMPYQPSFRHLTNILQINGMDLEKAISYYEDQLIDDCDKNRLHRRAVCAKNWIEKHAPEEFKFQVQDEISDNIISDQVRSALKEVGVQLTNKEWTDKELHEEFYIITKNHSIEIKDFFKAAYNVLINRDKGPQLANFILTIGREKVADMLGKL